MQQDTDVSDTEGPDGILEGGSISLDVERHRLTVEAHEVRLTATEFELLRVLMQRSGRVQTRETLLTDVWGYSENVDSRTVDTHIRRLRRKLGAEADRVVPLIGERMRAWLG